jgi:hypothetical protein
VVVQEAIHLVLELKIGNLVILARRIAVQVDDPEGQVRIEPILKGVPGIQFNQGG